MLLLLPIALLVYFAWQGGNPLGIALIVAGLVLEVVLALRMVRATVGGVGGHAEWVRDVSGRPRLERDPKWLWATGLVVLGGLATPEDWDGMRVEVEATVRSETGEEGYATITGVLRPE